MEPELVLQSSEGRGGGPDQLDLRRRDGLQRVGERLRAMLRLRLVHVRADEVGEARERRILLQFAAEQDILPVERGT